MTIGPSSPTCPPGLRNTYHHEQSQPPGWLFLVHGPHHASPAGCFRMPVAMRACTLCGRPSTGSLCTAHGGSGDRSSMTTTQRGYDGAHRRRRKALIAQAYGTLCARCGKTMLPGQALDLDHSTPLCIDPSSRGDRMTHAACNRGGRS